MDGRGGKIRAFILWMDAAVGVAVLDGYRPASGPVPMNGGVDSCADRIPVKAHRRQCCCASGIAGPDSLYPVRIGVKAPLYSWHRQRRLRVRLLPGKADKDSAAGRSGTGRRPVP